VNDTDEAGKEHRIIAHAADRLHDIGKEVS